MGPATDFKISRQAAGIVFEDTASALFGMEGLQVTSVEAAPDGGIGVWVVTACEAGTTCPECGMA